MRDLTAERVRELLNYDPETGIFTYRLKRGRMRAGTPAGTINSRGYLMIGIDGVLYGAHRLAWFYVYGVWPPIETDHIDGNTANNCIANLRLATISQNQGNRRRNCNNTSGFKGVSYCRRAGAWRATIHKNRKVIHLGYFDAPDEAHAAYIAAAERVFGEFARAA